MCLRNPVSLTTNLKKGVAELKYESGCRDVAFLRLYKDFGIMQNHFHTWNQQRRKKNMTDLNLAF
ncbi:hypothetical protein NIES4072_48160 [Nostoc commune NIES-4072]|uniref:Uncharacterized protein n=1 Tax=Nostoc commune NIES-4072 TaxID=2005467 RepID=A0A2R5FY33_NOSCO|nr:hypothetical protein NIES4070_42760 [Nostoc commune HK-02]GBG21133.1 hypothetical protein NIES4072_48160 [Nostoc commune NIES-4072]